MSRATALRLVDRFRTRFCIPSRLPPRLLLRPHRASPWAGDARVSGLALSNAGRHDETQARGLGRESIARVAVSQAQAPAQSEDSKSAARRKDVASAKDGDRKRLPPRSQSQRQGGADPQKKQTGKKKTKESTKAQDPRTTKPSSGRSPNNNQRPRQQQERPPKSISKTRVTWARVHQTIHSSSSSASKGASGDGPEPDSRELVTRLRGMHRQWGYLRHQYPASELLDHRRRFSSWKTKFHNILGGRHTGPYLWCNKGRWLFELDDIPAMRRAWEALDPQDRQRDWPLAMLSTLFSRPAKAEMVLEATLDPLPPGYAVLDVLTFVALHLRLEDIKEFRQRRIKAEQTFDLLARILEHMPPGHMPLWQRTLGLFARKLPQDLTGELYALAQRLGLPLHPNTQLQFARRLAGQVAHKQQAFEILCGLAERGDVDLNGPVPQSAITALLHCRPDHEGWSDETAAAFSPRRVLESLMERGFSPNHINATAFLDSLCQRSDVDEAIRLALLFAESGIQLDAKAWATIFRGAKHSLSADAVARSFDVAKAASAPLVDVLNNALHAVYFFADAESRETGAPAPWVLPLFEPMLYLYAQRFELGPLQQWLPDSLPLVITHPEGFEDKFGAGAGAGGDTGRRHPHHRRAWRFLQTVVPTVNRFFYAHRGARRLQPSTTTIALMLRAYARSLRQPYDLMAFYAFFKARLEEPGAPGAQLMRDQGSLIHDTIIMTMTERRGLSRPALQVFGDMFREQQRTASTSSSSSSSPPPSSSSSTSSSPSASLPPPPPPPPPPAHPPPSLCTFSILVRGLIARGDRLLAEQVIRVMREQGVEPDLVAWNTLVRGYAVMQDMGKTVQALQDMEAAGFRPDLFTFRAFGRLKDQGRALEMMEAIIHQNRQTMAADDWSS